MTFPNLCLFLRVYRYDTNHNMNMKKVLLIFVALVLFPFMMKAQVDWPYFDDNSNSILIPKRSQLFPLGWGEDSVRSERDRKGRIDRSREVSNYLYNKARKISKDTELPVIGFAKLDSQQPYYDYYIVEYDGHLYYFASSVCPDNSLIENKNNSISDHYEELKERIVSLSEEYLYQVQRKILEAESKLQYLEDNEQQIVDSLSKGLIAEKRAEIEKEYAVWESSVDASTKKALSVIRINTAYLASPNSAAGCDFVLNYTNMGKKIIKYLNWSGTTYNAVNDKVYCSIRNTCSFSGRDTGPVEPGQTSGGTWEAIIYNWSAKELRLNSIVITYMDGSSVTIPGKAAMGTIGGAPNSTITSDEIEDILSKKKAIVDTDIRRLKSVTQYSGKPENARFSSSPLLKPEVELYDKIKELAAELRQFKNNNSLPKWEIPENVYRLKLVDLQGL